MKKKTALWLWALALAVLVPVLAVRMRNPDHAALSAGAGSLSAPSATEEPTPVPQQAEWICRVVVREGDRLLLAKQDGTAAEFFWLDLMDIPPVNEAPADAASSVPEAKPSWPAWEEVTNAPDTMTAGCAVMVCGPLVLSGGCVGGAGESVLCPARLQGAERIGPLRGGFNDLCVLYLQVLEDLWAVDPGLNESITLLGVDLVATSLSPAEQSAVAWRFAQNHGLTLVAGSMEELQEQGYLTMDEPGKLDTLYHWEDGCLFTIRELMLDGVYHGLRPLKFNAMKWSGGLGAYVFTDCSAVQSGSGRWSEYTVGAHAVA